MGHNVVASAVLTLPLLFEHGNEPAGIIKARNILIGSATINFSKKVSAQWCSLITVSIRVDANT
jgi:hypothetical protein